MKIETFTQFNKWRSVSLLFALLFLWQLPYGQAADNLPAEKMQLEEAFLHIGKEYGVFFNYDREIVADITVEYESEKYDKVETALQAVFKQTHLQYQIFDQRFVAVYQDSMEGIQSMKDMISHFQGIVDKKENIYSRPATLVPPLSRLSLEKVYQKRIVFSVSGTVTDEKGEPLIGVNIQVKGSSKGTSTDFDGNFTLEDIDENAVLVLSYVGYQTQEIQISGKPNLSISMISDARLLDEIIVTGYMAEKKADLTGSVSVVSNAAIEQNSSANVMAGLQGRVPGVNITTDGNPTGNVGIQIRGITSLRSAPPLLVIDGLPSDFNLRDINPNDIESMQILKDAASASIYGSRAASGVILIETKKGKAGETKITYNGRYGISSFMNREKMMNTMQYGGALWQAAVNDGQDPNEMTQIYDYEWHVDNEGIPILDKVTPIEWLNKDRTMRSSDTDWYKAGSRLAQEHDHQLTLMNGTDYGRTVFSMNYHENQGTQLYTGFRRYSIRLNTDFDILGERLKIGENLSLSNLRFNDQNVMHNMVTMPPIVPVYTENGGWGGSAMDFGMDDYNNPVRVLTLNKDNYNHYNKVLGNVFAELKLAENLNLKSSYGIDYTAGNYRHIEFTWEEGGGKRNTVNGIRSVRTNALTKTFTNTANYLLDQSKYTLNVLGGLEIVNFVFEDVNAHRRDLELENYDYSFLNSAVGNQTTRGGGDQWNLISYFGKANFNLLDKYLFSSTLRYDGSSKFGKNNRFGLFPAMSLGWRISEEDFLKNSGQIDDLKLRASWGMNGNSNIPTNALVNYYDAAYSDGMSGTAYALGGNESGALLSGYRKVHTGNADIKWEATTQTNVGIDFGLLNGQLLGSIDYFYKYTDGMLFEPPYLGAIGEGGAQWINAANMTNTGIEMILTYNVRKGSGFNYSITGNIASYHNRIDDIPETAKFAYGGNGIDDDILGRPLNSFYGFIADGIFKSEEEVENSAKQDGKGLGRIRYKDLDGDGEITWENDRTWIGTSDPKFTYGINLEASYKQFDFSMFWQGLVGNKVRNDWKTYSDFWNVWTQQGFNHAVRLLDAWSPSNPNSDIPALSLTNPNDERRLSTYFIESGSYLKMRHLEVGYSIPVNRTNAIGIGQSRIYLNAQNIINLKKWWGDDAYTGVDPENPTKSGEYSSPYVRPQTFVLGITLSL